MSKRSRSPSPARQAAKRLRTETTFEHLPWELRMKVFKTATRQARIQALRIKKQRLGALLDFPIYTSTVRNETYCIMTDHHAWHWHKNPGFAVIKRVFFPLGACNTRYEQGEAFGVKMDEKGVGFKWWNW